MTLVVAGKSVRKGFSFAGDETYRMCTGLFFAADSVITNPTGNPIVEGFKKVVSIPVRVSGMNFLDTTFHSYHGYRYEGACAMAFAGSTLVSQHILNAIGNHLGDLKPTWFEGRYQLAMACEKHKLIKQGGYYEDDMFAEDFCGRDGLLTADYIAGVAKHAIETVLDHSRRHAGVKDYRYAISAEFILGLRCPADGQEYLYRYEIVEETKDWYVVKMVKVGDDEVAVIGQKAQHSDDARICYRSAIQTGAETGRAMLDYVSSAVRDANQIGVFGIGFPTFLYELVGVRLDKIMRIDF